MGLTALFAAATEGVQAKKRREKTMASYRYMLQRHKVTGALISPVESDTNPDGSEGRIKRLFELRPEEAKIAEDLLLRKGVAEVERRVTYFTNSRATISNREQARRIKEAGDERRYRAASLAAAQLQQRADRGDPGAQRELYKRVQPRLGTDGRTKTSLQIMDEQFQKGQAHLFAFPGLEGNAPAKLLAGLIAALPAAYLTQARTNEWVRETRRRQERGEYDTLDSILKVPADLSVRNAFPGFRDGKFDVGKLFGGETTGLAVDTFGAAGNQTLAMLEVGSPFALDALFRRPTSALSTAIREATGAPAGVADDLARGLKRAESDGIFAETGLATGRRRDAARAAQAADAKQGAKSGKPTVLVDSNRKKWDSIKQFAEAAVADKLMKARLVVGRATREAAEKLKAALPGAPDIAGADIVLISDEVRHGLKTRRDPAKEMLRNQLVTEPADYEFVEAIMASPDSVTLHQRRGPKGAQVFVFQRAIGGKRRVFAAFYESGAGNRPKRLHVIGLVNFTAPGSSVPNVARLRPPGS